MRDFQIDDSVNVPVAFVVSVLCLPASRKQGTREPAPKVKEIASEKYVAKAQHKSARIKLVNGENREKEKH